MAVIYKCRHCKQEIGELSEEVVDTYQLGLHELTEEEQLEMVRFQEDGNMQIQTICESCQDTLESNPQYHEQDYFIH